MSNYGARFGGIAIMLLISISAATNGQLSPPATEPAGGKILRSFEFNGSIDAAIAKLQQEDPNLKVVLARDPGAAPDEPHVNLTLKNVDAEDVLNVIADVYPGVQLKQINASTGSINVLRIIRDRDNGLFGNGSSSDEGVKIYNLSPLVDGWITGNMPLELKPEDLAGTRKKALDHILSLIQAALTQTTPSAAKPIMQIHEPTQTLVFKGTHEQRMALEEALQALRPAKGTDQFAGLEQQLALLRNRVGNLEATLANMQAASNRGVRAGRRSSDQQ